MKLICINCPRGCHLEVTQEDGEIKVSGNACPRGYTYAYNELTAPMRTWTSTVPIDSCQARRLPIISSATLPKDRIMDAMAALKTVNVKAPVLMGDVVVKNILDLGVDIIASKTIEK